MCLNFPSLHLLIKKKKTQSPKNWVLKLCCNRTGAGKKR
uniref:Uncharacterized protein n=1 Tax=Rhizophora mucronata TaxID=61149 RepID=A0A2P2NIU2_RHIMU